MNLNAVFDAAFMYWCSAGQDALSDPKFILQMVVVGVVVTLLVATIIVRYCRSKTDAVRRLTDCVDIGTYFRTAMTLLEWRHHRHHMDDVDFDAFFYCHDDVAWTLETLIDRLADRRITTSDDFFFGSIQIEQILKSIARSRVVILVLSPKFFSDG